jgi:hypothetical protein
MSQDMSCWPDEHSCPTELLCGSAPHETLGVRLAFEQTPLAGDHQGNFIRRTGGAWHPPHQRLQLGICPRSPSPPGVPAQPVARAAVHVFVAFDWVRGAPAYRRAYAWARVLFSHSRAGAEELASGAGQTKIRVFDGCRGEGASRGGERASTAIGGANTRSAIIAQSYLKKIRKPDTYQNYSLFIISSRLGALSPRRDWIML